MRSKGKSGAGRATLRLYPPPTLPLGGRSNIILHTLESGGPRGGGKGKKRGGGVVCVKSERKWQGGGGGGGLLLATM